MTTTTDTSTPTIACLGLGAMGSRMARRLLDAGYRIRGYNRSQGPRDELSGAGAECFRTPREAVHNADIVISMVTDDNAARAVWLDQETGALAALGPSAVVIESSTVTAGWINELSGRVGSRMLDAPVAGSRPQAEAGKLIFFVGGDAALLDEVKPVLSVMSSSIHHVGPLGQGAKMKLVVNALFGIQVAALSELLGIARSGGIEPPRAVDILSQLPITSPAVAGVGGLIVAGKFAPMFPIELVEKDFRYACATDDTSPITDATRAVFRKAIDAGYGDENIAAVARLYLG